ncbi:MAG: hypothetical protein N4A33_01460 [Bacteriovoracaceae bacterium]|jgi:hypothetical protein|nr:hypothetical protein [Bacteriovoracaceae bacterium]
MKGIILYFIFISIAFTCESTNLYKSSKSLQSIPILDQDSVGACYAYTASQILDVERFDNGVSYTKRSHPIWAAVAYKTQESGFFDQSVEGGRAGNAIKAIYKYGICTYKEGEALISKYRKENNLSESEFMNILESSYEYYNLSKKEKKEGLSESEKKEYASCKNVINSKAGDSVLTNIQDQFKISSNYILPKLVMQVILKDCVPKKKYQPLVDINKLKVGSCSKCSDKELENHIVKQLKRKKPVGISYCYKILNDKKHSGLNSRSDYYFFAPKRNSLLNKECGGHASMLVGSRKKNNKCQFLLRNTWGNWKSGTWNDCLCEKTKGVYVPCTKKDRHLNSVGCWIDSDRLMANTYRTVHF